jgi:hypothetical protein
MAEVCYRRGAIASQSARGPAVVLSNAVFQRSRSHVVLAAGVSAAILIVNGCGKVERALGMEKVPRAVIERQIGLSRPLSEKDTLENLETEIFDAADPRGASITQTVTPAERANGVESRYLVRWKAIARDEKGIANDASGAETIGKLTSGAWFTEYGIFDSDGHPKETKTVSGTYHGTYDAPGGHLDCTMTLGAAPDYAGDYECRGVAHPYTDQTVPTHFSGKIALFAVFDPDAPALRAGLLDGPFHFNTDRRHTRALILATDAHDRWQVAKGVEERDGALGIGFHGTSGFGDETYPAVFFAKVNGQRRAEAAPASDTASEPAPASAVTPASNATPVYSDTTYQPPTSSLPVTEIDAADELPGRPYPNPPTDAEAREAIKTFLGEVQGGVRTIDILGYRKLCAEPVGPECYVSVDGKRKVFTLQRKSNGRLEANDLGSCGD